MPAQLALAWQADDRRQRFREGFAAMPILPQKTANQVTAAVEKILAEFSPAADSPLAEEVQQALFLARHLQDRAAVLQTPAERRQQAELDRMMQHPSDKATLTQLTDQAFRSRAWNRSADQLIHVLDVQGVPRFFSPLDRAMLRGFQSFGGYLPGVAMPLVKEKMRQETANVVLPAEAEVLGEHLEARRDEGLRMNVNQLGEALLGEREARRRLDGYLETLQRPEIEVISVKISTIYSQISPLAREHTIGVLADRLELLFRAAAKGTFQRADGTVASKFVYLDMEEYRDMRLTADAFMQTLDRPGLENVRAGIVLQAYIPDAYAVQREINAWARDRVASGGAPITLRIVKGANMEMERVEASHRGWPQAPFRRKLDTDANYKRMMHEGLRPENLTAVRLGLASHNLFTLAYGLVMAWRSGGIDRVQFEMLEGMANHQRRALFELSQNLLLYAPTCRQEHFVNAIGYLVRRLDENTGEDNFLRHAFNITTDSDTWQRLEEHFVESFDAIGQLSAQPRRTQDRRSEASQTASRRRQPTETIGATPAADAAGSTFVNEPDTDWSLPHHSEWAQSIVDRWEDRHGPRAAAVGTVIAGEEQLPENESSGNSVGDSIDPSRPDHVVASFRQASTADIDRAVQCATDDPTGWRARSAGERRGVLYRVADELVASRGDLLGVMLAEGGKLLTESDPEVSEAIDFCRFYGDSVAHFDAMSGVSNRGRGVVAVVSPWNFPLAIPCGGIAASLAAGNTVIFKPASDTVLIAAKLCECFWRAGVPREALQFATCRGGDAGSHLVTHAGVDAVILTGGTETAERMLAAKPTMRLFAETGGKNATIVTALADRDLAIKNVLHSAFSHSGQKCSATSLLILEQEVYEDSGFRDALADAVESLRVGSAWNLATKVGPLIRPPAGDLERALKELDKGESWLVLPRLHVDDNPCLVSPGVKWGVSPGSYTHQTEFFGPVLGVMPARDLHEAIELVNATGYGLTSGLESLDDREHQLWRDSIRAGNLYINRPTTGAIVLRQPFGGMGKSNVGPGLKAGGPNYVAQLMRPLVESPPTASPDAIEDELLADLCQQLVEQHADMLNDLSGAVVAYEHAARDEFRHEHDHFRLIGEDNHRRYLPLSSVHVRVAAEDTPWEVAARVAAARVVRSRVVVSWSHDLPQRLVDFVADLDDATEAWAGAIEFVEQTDEDLAAAIRQGSVDRVRYAAADRVPPVIRATAAETLFYIADEPVTPCGRLELLWYLQEQSISHVYHRYGNLGARSGEARQQPA
ncbi:MAG: proline dehydrogenase family protein [Planctomycetota bacterium]